MSENTTDPDTSGSGYAAEQDPDADPEMMTSKHPGQQAENRRDPAEGAEDAAPEG